MSSSNDNSVLPLISKVAVPSSSRQQHHFFLPSRWWRNLEKKVNSNSDPTCDRPQKQTNRQTNEFDRRNWKRAAWRTWRSIADRTADRNEVSKINKRELLYVLKGFISGWPTEAHSHSWYSRAGGDSRWTWRGSPFPGFRGDERKRTLSFILKMTGLGQVHSGKTLEWWRCGHTEEEAVGFWLCVFAVSFMEAGLRRTGNTHSGAVITGLHVTSLW